MSAQSRERQQARRPSTLEGEASGPNYGTVGVERQAARPEQLLNGTTREPQTTTSSSPLAPNGSDEAPLHRATGPVDRTATAELDATHRVGTREVTVVEQQERPAPPQPQQTQEQLEAPTRPEAQHPRLGVSTVSEMVQRRARESLLQQGAVEQVELRREMTVEHVQGADPSVPHDVHGQRAQQRMPTWLTRVSEVLQRRFVSPMMEQVQSAGVPRLSTPEASPTSVWHSQPVTPTEAPPPLMSPDLRQAMTSWTTRPSLLTPKPRRAAGEESSSGSINQEAVAEEVKRQVKLALEERESTGEEA